jgi:putative FmdB family regulatory protein
MPVYEYCHNKQVDCPLGEIFEVEHPITDEPLKVCPKCGTELHRLISRTFISTPVGDSKLKNLGFTKLVRRDKGVYENVTATENESKFMIAGKPETMPDIKRKISD